MRDLRVYVWVEESRKQRAESRILRYRFLPSAFCPLPSSFTLRSSLFALRSTLLLYHQQPPLTPPKHLGEVLLIYKRWDHVEAPDTGRPHGVAVLIRAFGQVCGKQRHPIVAQFAAAIPVPPPPIGRPTTNGGRLIKRSASGKLRCGRDRKSTRLNSSHLRLSRMPSSA